MDVKEALDEIFDDDFIEIGDSNNDEVSSDVNKSDISKENKNIFEEYNNNYGKYKIVVFILIAMFIIAIVGIILFIFKEKTIVCTNNIKADVYKLYEEYDITYKKNKIIKLKNIYEYVAISDEYKFQIDYIKTEKLPVIINSNGMDGFTYKYEVSDNSYYLIGYLDFEQMDFAKIDKINKKLFPISYVDFDSITTYLNLKNIIEKKGFSCKLK